MGRLDEIQARCKAATPGPWEHMQHNEDFAAGCGETTEFVMMRHVGLLKIGITDRPDKPHYGNAAFIAHAREDVPWLLSEVAGARSIIDAAVDELTGLRAEVERLTAEREELKGQLESWLDLDCNTCPLERLEACDEICRSASSMLDYAGEIAADRDRLTAERDAAVADLQEAVNVGPCYCDFCRHFMNSGCDIEPRCDWQWRGQNDEEK